jgi:hypothetical protein
MLEELADRFEALTDDRYLSDDLARIADYPRSGDLLAELKAQGVVPT